MAIRPQITTPDGVIGPGLDKLAEVRPKAFAHANNGVGVYSYPFVGWRGQAAVILRRRAHEAASARLPLATGAALKDLAASEFETFIDDEPAAALGEVILYRNSGTLPQGVIRRGSRFTRDPAPDAVPLPVQGATYEAIEDVIVDAGATSAKVKLRATQAGAAANHIWMLAPSGLRIAAGIFDPNFECATFESRFRAAGGYDKVSDEEIRAISSAYARGQYAPISASLVAGAMRAGARYLAVYEDPRTAITKVFVADQKWASSFRFCSVIQQAVDDEFTGFGCRVQFLPASVQFVRAVVTVVLRDGRFLADTSEVVDAIQKAIRTHLDEKPDWWTFRTRTLRGIVARAHRKILTCSSVEIQDYASGTPVDDPPASATTHATHYYLADNATAVNFETPA